MSAVPVFDREVTPLLPLPLPGVDDPVARLFFDHTTENGERLLAVAEPVHRTTAGYLTARVALSAFEEALSIAITSGPEAGLYRAFAAANDAVRASNRQSLVSQRTYAGITAVIIHRNNATLGSVPPGQALIIQDERLLGVPDLATWEPGYMPPADVNAPEPLGFSPVVRPKFYRTAIGPGDQFVLGASAVGRVLAAKSATQLAELAGPSLVDQIESALAESGVDDAYAAWITFNPAPRAAQISPDRMAELEQAWHAQPLPHVFAHHETAPAPHRPRPRKGDRFHAWLIEASERHLARREADCLPLESKRRAATPPGAGSLHRYVAAPAWGLPRQFRSRLPRGFRIPLSKRALAVLVVVAMAVAGIAMTHDVRQTSADRQNRFLSVVRTEIVSATNAASLEEATAHLNSAVDALDAAADNGAAASVVTEWRAQIQQARDQASSITRLTGMARIGSLPGSLLGESPRLVFAGGRLFLIAGGVYEVGQGDHQLVPLMEPGDEIDGITTHRIVTATVDAGELLVTDGDTFFRLDGAGKWSATAMAPSTGEIAWGTSVSGVFKGNIYVLDREHSEIKKFGADEFDEDPAVWLGDDVAGDLSAAVDMAVAAKIHVLRPDGTVQSYYRGKPDGDPMVIDAASDVSLVGLHGGADTSYLYVVEIDNNRGKLIKIDMSTGWRGVVLAPSHLDSEYDAEAVSAFANTTDFVVDESAGVVYFVTTDGLWRAALD